MPFFFDPAFECTIRPGSIKNAAGALDASVAEQMSGKPIRYGDYITHKIRDVFPDLFEDAGMRDVLVERTGSSKL